jgi:hypothetical protein
MTTVYRKSSKGQQEIETRANRLTPRLRMALILVDGRRSDADLRALLQLDAEETLRGLLEGGYIEFVESPVAAAAPAPVPVGAPAVPQAGAPAASAAALAERRRMAVRYLTDQLGPTVEELAMRIEKARTWPELRTALELGRTVLHNARGGAAAARFAAQFIDAPLG